MSRIQVNEINGSSDNNFGVEFATGNNLVISGTLNLRQFSHFSIPTGNTAQRPNPAQAGMIRLNNELNQVEVYTGTDWQKVFEVGGVALNGSTEALAAESVQQLYDAGVTADGTYWMNPDGTARRYFVPLQSEPYYILFANYGGAANAFFNNASAYSGNQLDDAGTSTPTGNFASNGTYGYYRNAGGSDFKYATVGNRGLSYRYVKMKFHLYNYYSNDGVNGRNFLSISSGVGDGMTVMRDDSGAGDAQHIFTYYTAISNNDGNSCPSTAGTQPTFTAGGNNPGGFMGNRYTCFSRSGSSYSAEFVRNFTTLPGDNSGGTGPNVLNGDAFFTVDLGQNYSNGMHIVIHSDQDSGNEDTYLKRGVVLVRPA